MKFEQFIKDTYSLPELTFETEKHIMYHILQGVNHLNRNQMVENVHDVVF